MQLVIERSALLKSLTHIQGVVERRTTIPILSNVMLTARDGALALTATDMDLAIVDSVPAEISQDGATTVPAHTFHDIVRKLPEGAQIQMDSGGEQNRLTVKCGRSRLSLMTLPAEDFPAMAEGDLPCRFGLPSDAFRGLIDRTRFAMSTEETRYYLNGIYVHPTEADGVGLLRIVATDGHRLARVEMPLPQGAEGMPGVIVPRKTVGELRKLIEDVDGEAEIEVAVSETKMRFAFGGAVLTSKLIDGTFPDYERVIPLGNDKTLQVDARAFAHAVDLVSTITTDKGRGVKLTLDRGSLVLSATSPEAGSASEELEVDYADNPIEIGFNARYLLDIAEQIGADGARFKLADGASPTLVQDTADPAAMYVLMPLRV